MRVVHAHSMTLRLVLVLLLTWTASAATTGNDDTCDIGVAPAATLLLPYFEVDLDDSQGETTIFTITNVTNLDRIARVTLWTDYAYPVLTFNVELTGYDVQSISLYDVLANGVIGPEKRAARGRYSKANEAIECGELPRTLPPETIALLESAFTDGKAPECNFVGNRHGNAAGYATIDLVSNCSGNNPLAEQYWTEDLAFDNVLIGDYQQVHSRNDFAQGSPLVHIRAIPEGGTAAERLAHQNEHGANLTRTLYARYLPWYAPKIDSRQPLPSVFAARWIASWIFETSLKIWREGKTGPSATCATHEDNVAFFMDTILFDENENAFGEIPQSRITPITVERTLPATSLTSVTDYLVFPPVSNGAVAGWMYLNLDNKVGDGKATGNWVITSLRAEGRFSADMNAAPLGNGCSPEAGFSEVTHGKEIIRPRP